MEYNIFGGNLPAVTIRLNQGESIYTQSGGMTWMTENIEMNTNMKGGLFKGLGRMMSGDSIFMATYTAKHYPGEITISSSFPGERCRWAFAWYARFDARRRPPDRCSCRCHCRYRRDHHFGRKPRGRAGVSGCCLRSRAGSPFPQRTDSEIRRSPTSSAQSAPSAPGASR